MPSITVDEEGNSLYYEDSGAPLKEEDKPYTTIIILHGTSFHGGKPTLRLATEHNLRIVAVNRRHYPHSSPYTDEELDRVKNGDLEAHEDFAKGRAREYATFMKEFIVQNNTPRAAENNDSGGIVLMSWSGGNYYGLQILAFADAIDAETRVAIEPFFRKLIIYDPSPWTVGSTLSPHGMTAVMRDVSLTAEERSQSFNEYITGYYNHKDPKSHNIDDLQQICDPESRPSWIAEMTLEVLAELTCYAAVIQSEMPIRSAEPETYLSFVRRALCEPRTLSYFQKCGVDLLWCENTAWECLGSVWTVEDLVDDIEKNNNRHRRFRSIMIPGPGVNHFVHWDDPEKAIKYFTEVIST